MKKQKRPPTHPGSILKRHYMEPLGLSVSELAEALKVSRKTVSKLINEQGNISTDMALRLSLAFDTSPQLWLNLQQNYDLWRAAKRSKQWQKVHKIAA